MGLKDLVLDSGAREVKQSFVDSVAIRRAALTAQNRSLGFPTIAFPCEMTDSPVMEVGHCGGFDRQIRRHRGAVRFRRLHRLSAVAGKLNIFTDPQRPMVVTQGIYDINGPDENSPGGGHQQLLSDILHCGRRNRGQPGSHVAANQGILRASAC
jgi:acetyl-CoA decarbonylase/synthase complex subunit gamma